MLDKIYQCGEWTEIEIPHPRNTLIFLEQAQRRSKLDFSPQGIYMIKREIT